MRYVESIGRVMGGGDVLVVLLLGGICSSSGSGGLLGALLVAVLLVHPSRLYLGIVLLVVSVDVLSVHHLDCAQGGDRPMRIDIDVIG